MSAHWWWSWSIGLPSTDYSNSGFVVSSTANVLTNNTTGLFTPAPGSLSPSEEFHLRIQSTSTITSPAFHNGTINQGWAVLRYWTNLQPLAATGRIIELMDGASTVRVDVRPTSNAVHTFLEVRVNSTLVGTSATFLTAAQKYCTLAVDFDLTASPPQAGLVINGRRQVARAGGSGSPTTVDRVRLSSGLASSNQTFLGDVAIFSSLSDLTDQLSQDVWVTFLDPDAATDGDNSWTPSAGTDITAVNDATSTTYTEATAFPDTITYGFEDTTTRQASWSPTVIYGLAVVAYATASATGTNTTLDLRDASNVSAGTANATLTATNTFLGVWAPDDGSAAAWTSSSVNAATAIYSAS